MKEKYANTIGLEDLPDEIVKQVIRLGLEEKIKIYAVIPRREIELIALKTGYIEIVRVHHPSQVVLIFNRDQPNYLYELPPNGEGAIRSGYGAKVSLDDLRILKTDVEHPELKPVLKALSPRSEKAYLRIIDSLLCFIKGEIPKISKHPNFKHESQLIEALSDHCAGYEGLSIRNLSEKFANAKKLMSS